MTERPRTTSFRKQQILEKMQYNFQKIDPSFQIKYFLGDNQNLVEYQLKKWEKQNRIKTTHEVQIAKVIKTLRHPFTLASYMDQPNYANQTKNSTTIKCNNEAISPSPPHSPMGNTLSNPFCPLKKLILQYSDLVKDQYANSSDQMKKIIDRYSDTEQSKRPSKMKFKEFYSPRPKTMTRSERNKSIYQNLPQSPIPKNREHLVIKNNYNLGQLDDLQSELDGFKRSLFIMKQKNNQLRRKTNLKKPKKYDIFG